MILILNCGSQSIKWKLFETPSTPRDSFKLVKSNKIEILDAKDYKKLLRVELENLAKENISLIGHRVVHGDKIFIKPTKITKENINDLEKLNNLAPLHNPHNVLGIKACLDIFKNGLNVAVFDTEFFSELPEVAYTYAIPENIKNEFGFRRYGFHGISHEYVAKKACEILQKGFNKLYPVKSLGSPSGTGISAKPKLFNRVKIITCHLGGGASITAINKGKVIDTSMGFTPIEGLVMMTRPGNIDAGVVLDLVKRFGTDKAEEILNTESGLKGICGEGEMLKILDKIKMDDKKAKLALDVFVYSIKKYIGAYYAVLGGCDVLVFTGSIGSGSKKIRDMILKNLDILSKTKILAIETDEELAIAQKIIKR